MNCALLKENPVKKVEYIISLANSGMTRQEIAKEMGYKDVTSLYAFARRHELEWNKGFYIIKGGKTEEVIEEAPATGKIGSIISMFSKGTDGKEIAKSLRFSSYQEMADYMK